MTEELISLLCMVVFFNYFMQLSLLQNKWQILIAVTLTAMVVFFLHFYAIEQTAEQFSSFLSDTITIGNVAAVIIIEVIFQIIINNLYLKKIVLPQVKFQRIQAWLLKVKIFPSAIVSGSIFYIEVLFFRYYSFSSFSQQALLIAFIMFIIMLAGNYVCRWFLPSVLLRVEMRQYVLLIEGMMAVLLSASLTRVPEELNDDVHFTLIPVITIALVVLLFSAVGYFFQQKKYKKQIHKH